MPAINKTNLSKILRESVVDPRKSFYFKVIADVGNPDYYVKRALEELERGEVLEDKQKALRTAITLLAMARLELS